MRVWIREFEGYGSPIEMEVVEGQQEARLQLQLQLEFEFEFQLRLSFQAEEEDPQGIALNVVWETAESFIS